MCSSLYRAETKEDILSHVDKKRVQAPKGRMSLGPSEHPISDYEIVEEEIAALQDKVSIWVTGQHTIDKYLNCYHAYIFIP